MAGGGVEAARFGALRTCHAGCVEAPTCLAAYVVSALLPGNVELCSRLE